MKEILTEYKMNSLTYSDFNANDLLVSIASLVEDWYIDVSNLTPWWEDLNE